VPHVKCLKKVLHGAKDHPSVHACKYVGLCLCCVYACACMLCKLFATLHQEIHIIPIAWFAIRPICRRCAEYTIADYIRLRFVA